MIKKTLYLLLVSLITSCNSNVEIVSSGNIDTTSVSNPSIVEITDISEIEPNDSDTIKVDITNIPSDNTTYPVWILTTGCFHADEVQKESLNNDWYGIFKKGDSIYIEKTKLITSRVFDIIIDEDSTLGKTGWKVETPQKDTSIILVSGANSIKQRTVKEAILDNTVVLPDDTLIIRFNGKDYKLYATGDLVNRNKSHESYYKNYKLYISALKNGIETTQLIVAKPYFEDNYVGIICAGDFDGDGLLDLLMDTSSHYNATIPSLFLSTYANDDEIIRIVGLHVSTGC